MKRGTFSFFFFFFFFSFFFFSLFKTTEICFGSTKMGIFYWKKAFHAVKKIRKNDFAPLKNVPLTPLSGPLYTMAIVGLWYDNIYHTLPQCQSWWQMPQWNGICMPLSFCHSLWLPQCQSWWQMPQWNDIGMPLSFCHSLWLPQCQSWWQMPRWNGICMPLLSAIVFDGQYFVVSLNKFDNT